MNTSDCMIKNVSIATPYKIIDNGNIQVENGIIKEIGYSDNNKNRKSFNDIIVFPGFIDLNNNSLEKNLSQRKSFALPLDIILKKHDTEMTFYGITTVFYCVTIADLGGLSHPLRKREKAAEIINMINDFKTSLKLNTFIHLKYEILDIDSLQLVRKLASERKIDMLSLMDHIPRYGIYKDLLSYKKYLVQSGLLPDNAEEEYRKRVESRLRINYPGIEELLKLCRQNNIITVLHDPENKNDNLWTYKNIIDIAEYPAANELIDESVYNNVFTSFNAAKIVRGDDYSGNLNVLDIIRSGKTGLISSDYSPFSMLHALFIIQKECRLLLNSSVNLFSLNPAKAIRLNNAIGSIEKGKKADLTVVSVKEKVPRIIQTIIGGVPVYSTCDDDYFDNNFNSSAEIRNLHSAGYYFT